MTKTERGSEYLGNNDVGVLANKRQVQVAQAHIRAGGIGWVRGRDVVVETAGVAQGSIVPLTILT